MPYSRYTDPALYRRELERIFYGPHWSYVALEAEIPEPGDFRTTFVGERAVIVVRDPDGEFSVAFGVAQVPETWIVDPNGVVRARWPGKVTAEDVSTYLLALREGRA